MTPPDNVDDLDNVEPLSAAVEHDALATCDVHEVQAELLRCPPYQILCGGVCRYPQECEYWQ